MADGVVEVPKAEVQAAVEYTLSTPIVAYGEEVKVIKIRKPRGIDLIQLGNPVVVSPNGENDQMKVEHDYTKVAAYVSRLSNLPISSIELCDPGDLVGLAWAISPFFNPKRPTS